MFLGEGALGARRHLAGIAEEAVPVERRAAGAGRSVTTDSGTMQSKLAVQVPFWIGAPPASSWKVPPAAQLGNR